MIRALGRDLKCCHVNAAVVQALEQALAALAIKGLLIVKNFKGALTTRGIRGIHAVRLLDPRSDSLKIMRKLLLGVLMTVFALGGLRHRMIVDARDLGILDAIAVRNSRKRQHGCHLCELPSNHAYDRARFRLDGIVRAMSPHCLSRRRILLAR